MEELLFRNNLRSFSLENYYFTDQSIVVAVINYLKSSNNDCFYLGVDHTKTPILRINNFNYQLLYKSNLIGLISFDSISFNKVSYDLTLNLNNEKSANIIRLLEETYN